MTTNPSPAARTAVEYFEKWTAKDLDGAMAMLSDDFVSHTPSGRVEGPKAYAEFLRGFVQILTGAHIIAVFGDEYTALMYYDTSSAPVPDGPGAEWFRVEDGVIVEGRIVFDRLPFEAARAAQGG